MEFSMDLSCTIPLLMGLGLSACAGLRAWLPLLIVSILAHFDLVKLNDSMSILQDGSVTIALIIATFVEIVGDKVPAVDNFLDSVGTVLRPAAGTIASSSLLTQIDGGTALILGLIVGGGTAMTVHTGKSMARMATTATSPLHLGIGNTVISFLEDVVSFVTAFMAIIFPCIAAFLALTFIAVSFYFISRWKKAKVSKHLSAETA